MKEFILKILASILENLREILTPKSLIAFAFYGTFCYLILKGINVPDPLNNIVSFLMGRYFGYKEGTSESGGK